jgi:hypothetical protein
MFFQMDWDNLPIPVFEDKVAKPVERPVPVPIPQRIPVKGAQRKSSIEMDQDFVPLNAGSAKKGKQKKDAIQKKLEKLQQDVKDRVSSSSHSKSKEVESLKSIDVLSEKEIHARFGKLYGKSFCFRIANVDFILEAISTDEKRALFSDDTDEFMSDMVIQGTCNDLEKMYLRLTDVCAPFEMRLLTNFG